MLIEPKEHRSKDGVKGGFFQPDRARRMVEVATEQPELGMQVVLTGRRQDLAEKDRYFAERPNRYADEVQYSLIPPVRDASAFWKEVDKSKQTQE